MSFAFIIFLNSRGQKVADVNTGFTAKQAKKRLLVITQHIHCEKKLKEILDLIWKLR